MSKKIDRRGFLKALPFIPKATVEEIKSPSQGEIKDIIRPPYISEISNFTKCAECTGECVAVCEERILFRLKDGSPHMVYGKNGCTFCGKCADVCEYGILSKENPAKINVEVKININKCMAWNGVMCFSCREPCLDNAIKFEGIFKPRIVPDMCTGCGFCTNVCPSQAVEVSPLELNKDEEVA